MSVILYDIFLFFLRISIPIASLFNPKAKKWVQGRKNIFDNLKMSIPENEKIVWMHCASLGEFEQGKPLLEKIRIHYPQYKILLTFFSPSGYEAKKNYTGAEWIFYLPLDGARNAKRFLEIVHPSLVIFVKYEFWYYYLKKIKYRNIPLILVSALFRKNMSFFKWYGKLQRKMLGRFDHLFVQNQRSKDLIDNIGLSGICSISGDTRFDRVIEIAQSFEPIPLIEKFIDGNKTIVAGSTWPEDEKVLQKTFSSNTSLKLIIAPHEINEKHLKEIKILFPDSVLYSELITHNSKLKNVLIIDNIGMLARLYKYAFITYVGGGLASNGVHNVLEAAVYNKIVLFGPWYYKYNEAIGLIKSGGGLSFNPFKKRGKSLQQIIDDLLNNNTDYEQRSKAAGDFVFSNKGATERIIQFIQEKRLLTN